MSTVVLPSMLTFAPNHAPPRANIIEAVRWLHGCQIVRDSVKIAFSAACSYSKLIAAVLVRVFNH